MQTKLGLKRQVIDDSYNFPLCLAPMVGLTHVAMRVWLKEFLPQGLKTIWPTEMLNSRKIPHEVLGQTPETYKAENDADLVPQILGNEDDPIQKTVEKLCEWGVAGIDINMGCPVKKALRHNYGVALMGDSEYAKQVVETTVKHSRVPVSVKLRAGHQNDKDYLLNFMKGLEQAGASWLTLHPRVAEAKRRGKADWTQIRWVRDQLQIPVLGNGDIQSFEDVLSMFEVTDCDMVMVGRVLTAKPWIISEFAEYLGYEVNQDLLPKSAEQQGALLGKSLIRLLEIYKTYFDENLGVRRFKFHIKNAHPWLSFGHQLFAITSKAKTYNELELGLRSFFEKPQPMQNYTELRY